MPAPTVSLILPTYNEAANLPLAVERALSALRGRDAEIIVVDDDSPDGTWRVAEELAQRLPIRVFRRIGRRGLSSAVVEGFAAARGEALAVMDADLQHDASILPRLMDGLSEAEAAVATRYAGDGGTGAWGSARLALSRTATWSARRLLRVPTSDPMSGFFAIRRSLFQRVAPLLRPRGYKILLEILLRGGVERVHEVPYVFANRLHGTSKLRTAVLIDCAAAMWELRCGGVLPLRFVKYCLVGLSGVAVQLGATWLLRLIPELHTPDGRLATAVAIAIAMLSNYILDNLWTFRDLRHRSVRTFIAGALRFTAVCGTGAVISWSVAQAALSAGGDAIGLYPASLLGIVVATVWNYALNRQFTWRGAA